MRTGEVTAPALHVQLQPANTFAYAQHESRGILLAALCYCYSPGAWSDMVVTLEVISHARPGFDNSDTQRGLCGQD